MIKCLFGFHDYANNPIPANSWYWFRACKRCGKWKRFENKKKQSEYESWIWRRSNKVVRR